MFWGVGGFSERAVEKFSSFLPSGKGETHLFILFWGVGVLFSDSLAFFTLVALFFVPKDPLGSDNGPKQNFKKT